jgi:hypothetical protein
MPRYIVTGTRKDIAGFHEVTVEAATAEDAREVAVRDHGLLTVVSVEDPLRPTLEPLENRVPGAAPEALRPRAAVNPDDALHSAGSAVGCLWFTIAIIGLATMIGAIMALNGPGGGTVFVGIVLGGVVSMAVPRALIAIIDLLSVLVRQRADRPRPGNSGSPEV